MFTEFLPKHAVPRRLSLILVTLIVSAWVVLFAWQRSPYAELLGHDALAQHQLPFAAYLALFLLSWLLMIVAMMLPVNLPVIVDSYRDRPRSIWAAAEDVVGYLIPWVLFGLLAFFGDRILHEITEHGRPLAMAAGFITPAIILAAGIYQLTPIKRSFTERCRSIKNSKITVGHQRMGGVFSRGLQLGLACFGSCWMLMLLMFALGHHRLEWMLIIGAIVGAERLASWGLRLARIVGLTLIVWTVVSVAALM